MVNSDKEKPVSLAPLKTAEALRGLFKVDPATLDVKKSKKTKTKRRRPAKKGTVKKAAKKKAASKGGVKRKTKKR